MIDRCLLLLLLCLLPASSLQAQLELTDGLWLFQKGGSYERLSNEAFLMPTANRSVNPDWLACVVMEASGQNVLYVPLEQNGRFRKSASRRLFDVQKKSIALTTAPRTVDEIAWSLDGRLLLAVTDGGEHGRAVWLADPSRKPREPIFSDDKRRSDFVVVSRNLMFFVSGDSVYEWRKGRERRLFSRGYIHDLSYLPSEKALLYYRAEGSNAGVYMWSMDGEKETMIINLPSTSELSPRYNINNRHLAFVSNHEPDDVIAGSSQRLDIRRRWHLYEAPIATFAGLPVDQDGLTRETAVKQNIRMPTPLLIDDKDYQDLGLRNRNVFKWVGGSIFFQSQGESEEALRSIRSVGPNGRLRTYRFDAHFERDVTSGDDEVFQIRGNAVVARSFDVFMSGNSVYIALSAEANLAGYLLGQKVDYWRADTYLLLFSVPKSR